MTLQISDYLKQEIEEQHRKNIAKWGHQDPLVLLAVLTEEIGEVNKALLQEYFDYEEKTQEDVKSEVIDSMAVLVEIYYQMDKWDLE